MAAALYRVHSFSSFRCAVLRDSLFECLVLLPVVCVSLRYVSGLIINEHYYYFVL